MPGVQLQPLHPAGNGVRITDAEDERRHWNALADDGDVTTSEVAADFIIEHLSPIRPRGEQPPVIIDLGCGVGHLTRGVAAGLPQARVLGVDISPSMIQWSKRFTAFMTDREGVARFITCDGRSVPEVVPELWGAFAVGLFDVIPPVAARAYIMEIGSKSRAEWRTRLIFDVQTGMRRRPFCWQVPPEMPRAWCEAAGMKVVDELVGGRGRRWFVAERSRRG